MRVLDRKLVRDLFRLWPQSLAIALVMACGVATLIMAVGAFRSLDGTRAAYYERYRFGDIFASATRAPRAVAASIAEIDGVAAVEARIAVLATADIEGMREPANVMLLSLGSAGQPAVNALFLREGRLPESGRANEAVVSETFAAAHGFGVGSRFPTLINGAKTTLTVVGLALSPEYVYALGPGDMMPDRARFGVAWMPEKTLATLADLEGAFNNLSLRLLPGANETAVIEAVDALLDRYGGSGAYARKDQMSHAFLDGELTQLQAMARIIPPIFLLVSAFLINMILSRLISLEREQIGLLKALGYSRLAVLWHYLKLVLAIAAVGLAIGAGVGTWIGRGMTEMYSEFYSFPFLIFSYSPDAYVIAGGATLFAAIAGAVKAMGAAFALPAAVAMRPPTPVVYRKLFNGAFGGLRLFTQITNMAFRNMVRHPLRTAITVLGTSFAIALFTIAMGAMDSVTFMMDTIFFRSNREDVTLVFASPRPPSVMQAVARLPGVIQAEPSLDVPVRISNGRYARQLAITGRPPATDLSKILDLNLRPVHLPESGLVLGDRVAGILHVQPGDVVHVEVLNGERRSADIPVTQVIQSYVGLMVYMNLEELGRLAWGGPRVSGASVQLDAARLDDFYRAIKDLPQVASAALLTVARLRFQETMQTNMNMQLVVYLILSVVISFGVVYNAARIQLSERARELATLRVLGFTRAEIFSVLAIELGTITAMAQPLGWLLGYLLGVVVTSGIASDLFRVPFVVEADTFAAASLVVIGAALISIAIVRRRVNRLDLVRVLKTRE